MDILCPTRLFLDNKWTEYDIGHFCNGHGEPRPGKEADAGKTHAAPFYTRVVTNQLRYGPLSKDFLPVPSPANLHGGNVRALYGLGINTLAVDYIDPLQMREHVWAWDASLDVAELHRANGTLCVVMRTNTTTWSVAPCRETHPALCQHAENLEVFVKGALLSNPQLAIPSLHEDSSLEWSSEHFCPEGYVFSPPTTTWGRDGEMRDRRQQLFASRAVNEAEAEVWVGFRLEPYYFLCSCLFHPQIVSFVVVVLAKIS